MGFRNAKQLCHEPAALGIGLAVNRRPGELDLQLTGMYAGKGAA